MPEFSTFFNMGKPEKKLNSKETLLALRYLLASEYEAIQMYEQVIDALENKLAKKVLGDITKEEKEHIGELKKLIEVLYPEELEHYAEGAGEVEEMMEEE